MNLLQISQIWIYPVKSLGGISVSRGTLTPKGLAFDRRWMLVDAADSFLTQREHPKMALFKTALTADALTISFASDAIHVPLQQSDGEHVQATIFDDQVTAARVGDKYDEWFTKRLGIPCSLVQFPESSVRAILGADPGMQVSLADAFPYLVVGEASLDDLNGRLQKPLPMNRFRPNIVFRGGTAYEEDAWRDFSIGGHAFMGVRPSKRCVITTVDQQTAEKGSEPLRTLASYRQLDKKVIFGLNAIGPATSGEINVGDPVEVRRRSP